MHIKNALRNIESFAELEPVVKKTQTGISFFGWCYISVTGYEGKLPIDSLAAKVLELIRKNPDFDEIERQHGKAIMRPVDNLYRFSDKLIEKANFIAKFINKLIGIYNFISSGLLRDCSKMRWDWCDGEFTFITTRPNDGGFYKAFQIYTEKQYKNVFGNLPHKAHMELLGLKDLCLYMRAPKDIYDRIGWFDDENVVEQSEGPRIIYR